MKVVLLSKVLSLSLFCVSLSFSSVANISGEIKNENVILDSNVPDHIMNQFKVSFVYEDGYFCGARVDMLRPYLSSEEIKALV